MDPVPADLPEPDVLDFLDYRVYLRRRFEAARARHRRLSMAWLSRRLGVSGGHVINVLQGRRNLGVHTAVSAAAALGLREDRARYLPLLVEYNDAPDAHTALYAWRELSLIRARHGRELDAQADSPLFLRWTVPVVLTLSTRADWRPDPRWISATLRPHISAEDAADALRVLTAAGYLVDRPRRSSEVVRSPHWLDAHRVARLHDECLDVARDVDALGLDPCLEVELAVDGTFSLGETLDVWWEAIAAAASPCDGAKDSAPAHMFLANAFPPGPAPP